MQLASSYPSQWQQLDRAVQQQKLGHAYILSGADVATIETFASQFIQSQICQGSPRPCASCPPCRQMAQAVHPDVFRLTPEKQSITIEQIRSLEERLHHKACHARKWIIIQQAQTLNQAASQAFLKTLEEPINATFFLITHQPTALLLTIRSRCQSLSFQAEAEALVLADYQDWLQLAQQQVPALQVAQQWQRTPLITLLNQVHCVMATLLKLRQSQQYALTLHEQPEYTAWQRQADTMNLTIFWQCFDKWRHISHQVHAGVHFNQYLLLSHFLHQWQLIWGK